MVKNPLANAGDVRDSDSIPGAGRSPGEGHGNPLQYSCLENPMDRGAQRASLQRVAELDITEVTKHSKSKGEVKVKSLSRVQPSATPWTAAHQAPLSMGFSRQEY